ncbi:alpha-galactosidase [Niabella drilacis]|uniref:Melibiase n=1 Tax=Niabella drilacis (strain DSM 25811 / CCM 8410 / CCUG 62505 / LMG 26954 / E90) TaxID=1285928 RepID=A0A1G6RL33_NIADE|nr:alpha-galactosidase [Niabella drilacis]SDD05342.1 Melibiase [Niabella drilacis]
MKRSIAVLLLFFLSVGVGQAALVKDSVYRLQQARVTLKRGNIIVSTGRVERTWRWSGTGWQTVGLRSLSSGREYAKPVAAAKCDWNLPGAITDSSKGELLDIAVSESDDEGFSSRHLQVISTIKYPDGKLMLQHIIWVYPNATGIRTQLRVKALDGFNTAKIKDDEGRINYYGNMMTTPGPRCEYLPLGLKEENQRRYWGYYNNPGGRHDPSRLMLEEKVVTGYPVFQTEDNNWASGLSVEYNTGRQGVCVVKESPKCVNQPAHYTGSFYSGPDGVRVTGWGLAAKEIITDCFRDCWATWTILWDGGNDGMQMALKRFDRARYPVFPERDLFILSNTWGPANPGGAQFTDESFLKKEIPALANIGIDVMQIDDGWQKNGGSSAARDFSPRYRNGWKDLKQLADQYKLRFGLWVTAQYVTVEELKKNIDALGFISWKVDFDHLASRKDYEDRISKYRAAMKYAPMKNQFTLCPEYDDPRYGWYYCKEYGSIYFQNIQEGLPEHLAMVPYQVLMQHWLMSKYFNSNKLQVMLQNPKRVNPALSDAPEHSHSYCFAMGLPFVPCFFQSGQYLDPEGTAELKAFIAVFKKHQEKIFTAYTFPVGDQPDNRTWSGFQMVSESGIKDNYLLLFREIHNKEPVKKIKLKFLAGKTIRVTDVKTGAVTTKKADKEGGLSFTISRPADFLFLKYDVAGI